MFSSVDHPLPKGEATYNQWTFEVCSVQSCYQEEVLQVGIIWSLKDEAADMVRYLGPSPSINAILEQLDSLYDSVSTSDIMMHEFYRESQVRSKFIAHYVARLEGKLNKIYVKHLNRVSEMETTGYIRDCLFYGLRKPL